jgi:hypothetical protein
MANWPRDNQTDLIKFYGDPGTGEIERRLVKVVPPFKMYYSGKPVRSLLFHEKAAPALAAALNDVWDKCGRSQAKIDALGISKTAGTYNKRKISGSDRWSNHAYGGAIDINAEENGFNTGKGTIPPVLVAAFDAVGFRWGGRYKGRTDPMHFEAVESGLIAPVGFLGLDLSMFEGIFDRWDGHERHEKGCICDGDEGTFDDHGDQGEAPATGKPSLFKRISAWLTGGGATVGTFLYDYRVALIVAGCLVALVLFLLWLFGKKRIADWLSRQFG